MHFQLKTSKLTHRSPIASYIFGDLMCFNFKLPFLHFSFLLRNSIPRIHLHWKSEKFMHRIECENTQIHVTM